MKKTDERTTPKELFDLLNAEFDFEIDLAATPENAKLPRFYTKEDSAFNHIWRGRCFCNPPYSEIYRWLQYAVTQPAITVFVLPCDTSTRWFHNFLWDEKNHKPRDGIQLRFPKGRFKFGRYSASAKFATIIAVIDGRSIVGYMDVFGQVYCTSHEVKIYEWGMTVITEQVKTPVDITCDVCGKIIKRADNGVDTGADKST